MMGAGNRRRSPRVRQRWNMVAFGKDETFIKVKGPTSFYGLFAGFSGGRAVVGRPS